MTRRKISLLALLVACALGFLPTTPASAHNDGGVDEAFVAPQMNQESYWEARFGPGTDCTKFENHDGFIPAHWEIAIVHDAQKVRVYNPAPDDDYVLGPQNTEGNNADKDVHYAAPHSWVTKCDTTSETTTTTTVLEETTTTTVPEETTTTIPEETTTSTTAPETTTSTTLGETTTTTTTSPKETTTTSFIVNTTHPGSGEETTVPGFSVSRRGSLPFTGSSSGPLLFLGSTVLAMGLAVVRGARRRGTRV